MIRHSAYCYERKSVPYATEGTGISLSVEIRIFGVKVVRFCRVHPPSVHAKLKTVHDTFIKKNFKLTKDAYAAQHKDELDAFNKAVRTLMKLNGSTAVDFSALDAEFSALQSSSAELRTQLETLQPDVSALKNIRKYIDMVLNKQQLSAPGGKTPEKESVLKKLNDSKAALEQKELQTQPKESEHTL